MYEAPEERNEGRRASGWVGVGQHQPTNIVRMQHRTNATCNIIRIFRIQYGFSGGIRPLAVSRFNTDLLKIKNRDKVVLCIFLYSSHKYNFECQIYF